MANMHLVTGYAGREHVTAADQAAFHNLFIGGGEFVLDTGNQFAASIISNNQVRVLDGDIYMQGRFIRLDKDTYIDLVIENGAQGYSRNDLIVARYTENQVSAVEEVNLVVIKGEPAVSDPADPAYTTGDILVAGDMLHDMPLYRVVIDGLEIVELVPLFRYDSDLQLMQKRTNLLPEGISPADGDYFPVFDSSENKHKKMPWKNIRKHNHSANEIIEGVLPVERGGTGAATQGELLENLGLADISSIAKLSPAGTGTLYVYCKDENGNPVYGCVVQIGEEIAVTGESGAAKYFLAPGTYSVTVTSPIDYGAESQTKSVTVTLSNITSVEVTVLDSLNGETVVDIHSSGVFAFSDRVASADVFCVGGGASGGVTRQYASSATDRQGGAVGGAGGYTATAFDILLGVYAITIGSGGAAVAESNAGNTKSPGLSGGETEVRVANSVILSAKGGKGASGYHKNIGGQSYAVGADGGSGSGGINLNNAGAGGEDGADGADASSTALGGSGQGTTTRAFGEPDGELFASAGAGVRGSGSSITVGAPGTNGGAGAGKYFDSNTTPFDVVAQSGQKPGCGGGAAVTLTVNSTWIGKAATISGAGANGLVRFRWEVSA